MPLFESFRARRLVRRAQALLASEGLTAATALLDAGTNLGGEPWARFAVFLYNQERPADAERAIRRALAIEPRRGDALIFLAELLAESGREDEAIVTYRQVLAHFPAATAQAVALARLLVDRDDHPGAREALLPFAGLAVQEVHLLLAEIFQALGEHQRVVDAMAPLVRQMKLELQGAIFGSARDALMADYQEAMRLHDQSYAAQHGQEQVVEAARERGDLDASAGVNYHLMGEARMVRPRKWAADVQLRSVDEGHALGLALVAGGERSRGLCHLGLAQLRQGRLKEARKLFQQARREDDDNFAAYLGLGAAMDLENARAFSRLEGLPRPPLSLPGLEAVVVDWRALTEPERKVVALCAAPLAGVLPHMAAAGAVARILPIDARLTDLPEMSEGADERLEDHRCMEGITGASTERLCASKVEELLKLTGDTDSVFAHELAHLAHAHLTDELCEEIEKLFQRAAEQEHVLTAYQTTNVAEFFAVAYTDFLAHELNLPSRRELDEEGIVEDTFALIRRLAG